VLKIVQRVFPSKVTIEEEKDEDEEKEKEAQICKFC
jgi:hypothetical protein